MGSMTSLYLDEETLRILNEKKKDPNFNLSQFVKEVLRNDLHQSEKVDPELLRLEYEKIDSDIINLKNKSEFLKDAYRKLIAKKEFEENERMREELLKEKKKDNLLQGFTNSILEYFNVTEDEATDFAEEYANDVEYSRDNSIMDFMQKVKKMSMKKR